LGREWRGGRKRRKYEWKGSRVDTSFGLIGRGKSRKGGKGRGESPRDKERKGERGIV